MYLRLCFCALLLSMSLSASLAQVKFGVKAGGNFSFLSGGDDAEGVSNQSGIGFNTGAFSRIKFGSYGVQLDLLYSLVPTRQTVTLRGSEIGIGDISTEFTYNFSYFAVPVGFRYYFPAGPYLQLGPQFNFLLSNSIKAKVTAGGVSLEGDLDADEFPASNIDWGVFGGGGYAFPFGLSIDLRYYTAVSKLFNLQNEGENEMAALLNSRLQAISLGVGYTF